MDATRKRGLSWKEIGAAASVVLSLVFVGYEIRQNTKAVRATTLQAMADSYTTVQLDAMASPEIAGLVVRTFHGAEVEDFSPEENTLIAAYYMVYVAHLENTFNQRNAGFIDASVFESFGWRNQMLSTPHFRAMMGAGVLEATVSPEFADFFGEFLGF